MTASGPGAPRPRHSSPNLKLFSADADADEPQLAAAPDDGSLAPQMPLSLFYRRFFRPVCLEAAGKAKRSIDQYNQVIEAWSQITGDPPLQQIDEHTGAGWLAALRLRKGLKGQTLSPNTVRKYAIHLQAVLDRAGPKTRAARNATELLHTVPWIDKPAAEVGDVEDVFTLAEVGVAISAALRFEHWRRCEPSAPIWFAALFTVLYNCGLRLQTALALRWCMILPEDEFGLWARVPVRFGGQKCVKGKRPLRVYFNRGARAALEAMRPAQREATDQVFAWPYSREASLQEARRELLQFAGLPAHRRFGFRGFRKACNTALQEINPSAAKLALGHSAGRDVNLDHYTHRRVLAQALDRLPQPAIIRPDGARQLDLF